MGKCSNKDEFIKLFYESCSISDLGRKLGYSLKNDRLPGGVSRHIRRYIDLYQLDKNFLLGSAWAKNKTRDTNISLEKNAVKRETPWEKAFSFGSKIHNQCLLKRLVRAGKKKYECEICCLYEWQNKEIILELHHKNGVHYDNREENLQILCPNCHSQVEKDLTSKRAEVNKKFISKYKPVIKCINCSNIITKFSTSKKCKKCIKIGKRKVNWPLKEQLAMDITTMSWCAIGRKYGVSDNAVRKWAKQYEII